MTDAKLWLAFAYKDLLRARRSYGYRDFEDALYHLQQAVEKSLKALLIYYDIRLPSKHFRTHDIGYLVDILKGEGISVPKFVDKARSLTSYAFTTRYPDDYVPVGEEEYEEAYEIAVRVYEWAKGIVGGQP